MTVKELLEKIVYECSDTNCTVEVYDPKTNTSYAIGDVTFTSTIKTLNIEFDTEEEL